ncbi:carboxypeptidase-like regulatory domain-containing protein [Belliella sp. DSM 111904]|uniref:Carboxypeptidase-like regulatory domain-containing protein n=1 Tax=Belliella filtrata TaxID=2923435 RepID=A0ABS9V4D6_9BACT|nr:carboxypeptidase-like regulatory domain-containing protein [Belliella filtrata]MCH7411238.1 carboxypeptidase-like regulatory domain-containing protein [Belliella filtrata]
MIQKFYIPILLILIFILFMDLPGLAQGRYASGVILDRHTEMPVAYANVGVKSKFTGTVSDSLGYFSLRLDQLSSNDTIRVFRMGYSNELVPVEKLSAEDTAPFVILLEQYALEMSGFTVTTKAMNGERNFGSLSQRSVFAYAFNPSKSRISENLGREIAIEFDTKNRQIMPKKLKFVLSTNQIADLVFRVNIYVAQEQSSGFPDRKVFEKVFDIEDTAIGEVEVALDAADLQLEGKVWLSLEFVGYQNASDQGILTMPVKYPFGKMYIRDSSLGEWKKVQGSPSILLEAETY